MAALLQKIRATLLLVNGSHQHSTGASDVESNHVTADSRGESTIKKTKPQNIRRHTADSSTTHSTIQTRYIDMLLGLDRIPRSHNLLASFSTWILLAGFLIVPGTFTSVEKSRMIQEEAKQDAMANEVLHAIKHASLLWISVTCCLVGCSGLVWLWWRWRSNYVWLINKIFLVATLNAVAGLISTLINVYTQQGGRYSITAKATVIATGSCAMTMTSLFFLYNNWILEGVKQSHSKELGLDLTGKDNRKPQRPHQ